MKNVSSVKNMSIICLQMCSYARSAPLVPKYFMEQLSESSVQTTPAGYYCDINGLISAIYDPADDSLKLDWGDHC